MAILKKRTLLADGDAGFDPLSERGKDSSFLSVPLTIETAAMCDMDLTHTSIDIISTIIEIVSCIATRR